MFAFIRQNFYQQERACVWHNRKNMEVKPSVTQFPPTNFRAHTFYCYCWILFCKEDAAPQKFTHS